MSGYDEAFFNDEFDEIGERRIERQPASAQLSAEHQAVPKTRLRRVAGNRALQQQP
jgi:hypothetical protein